jgi:hypothetical protein
VISSMAVPLLSNSTGYSEARLRRNAQEIASVANVANAVGMNLVVEGDLEATLKNILTGGKASGGAFKNHFFGVRSLTIEDARAASKYLSLEDDALLYIGSGATSGVTPGHASASRLGMASTSPVRAKLL